MIKQFIVGMAVIAALAAVSATPAIARGQRLINESDTVVLHGNVHPLARAGFDVGATDYALPMERMILALRISPEKQAALDRLTAEQQDPASANYHRWLTPEEFGERFGPDPDDIDTITGWLGNRGFTVESVARGRLWINFSGPVSTVERVFRTNIRNYRVNGRLRHANSGEPSIPRALGDVVAGIVSLHNFPRRAMNTGMRPLAKGLIRPFYTTGTDHYLAPGDFATIYNVKPLYDAGIDGTGQSIAIVGRTHPSASNWSEFRSIMGLPANPPQVIVNGPDPGDLGADEDGEADLDVEWAGAVAKNATIRFVISGSTETTDGVDLSAQHIVDNNLAPVMSTSFGLCESMMGSAENAFYRNLWQQAATQGITSFVSSGDSGVAGCDSPNLENGTGSGINGLASTPHNVAVGGTQFNEGTGSYWNTGNGAGYTSALGYIPEIAWNESGNISDGYGLWATGGGASIIYGKPSWQVCPGVPADGKRDIPDVSLSGAGHDAYLVQTQGELYFVGGTSASSPAFAGIMALVVQKTGQRQGNANTRFYQLGSAQFGSGGAAVFHDVTNGNNSVPGVTGYSCAAGYDAVTGLGSVNAAALVDNWAAAVNPDFAISVSPKSVSAVRGGTATSTVTTTVSGGFSSAVSLSVSGLPAGVTAAFTPSSIAAPGSGSSKLTLAVSGTAATGTFTVTVSAAGGGKTHAAAISLTITAGGSVTLFSDGFEDDGWATRDVSGSSGAWRVTGFGMFPQVKPHGGKMLADFNSYIADRGNRTRIYRTTGFTVPQSASRVTLKFWMYHETGYPANKDLVQTQVSTDGTTWSDVGAALPRYNGTTGWAPVSIDLSAYRGRTVYLGFVGISAFGNDEYLDDVSVVAE